MEMWNIAMNKDTNDALTLVNQEGRNLLGSLAINSVAEDDVGGADEGEDEEGEHSDVQRHRKSSHSRGRESIRLNGMWYTLIIVL